MSLDFPKRNDWLAIRATKKRRWRYVFRSTSGFPGTLGYLAQTFNAGRNKAKRLKRKKAQELCS